MSRIQLSREWTETLLSKPESGMGYQRVEVYVEDGSEEGFAVLTGKVLNGEWLELDEDIRIDLEDIEDIQVV